MYRLLITLLIPVMILANANDRLAKTLNLGNYLEAPNEGDWSSDTITKVDLQRIALKGFSAVRLPVRWSNHISNDNTIDSTFINRVERVINYANSQGLTVVLDDHHFDSLMVNPDKFSPVSVAMWQQIASQFKDYDDTLLYFEPENEPNSALTSDKWNALLDTLIKTIRVTNPTRPIVCGTTGWGGVDGLIDLKLPWSDSNLIVTVHYYRPMEFTHQGASWVTGADNWLGTEWNGTYYEKKAINEDLQQIAMWQAETGKPIFIGEFGSYEDGDMTSRVRWTEFCARSFEEMGLSWAYWEYNSGFGLFDKSAQIWRHELSDVLFSTDKSILKLDSSTISYGAELIKNGNFAEGQESWVKNQFGGKADADFDYTNDKLKVTVKSRGDETYNIQLLQSGINLEAGKRYTLSVSTTKPDIFRASIALMRNDYSVVAQNFTKRETDPTYELIFTTPKAEDSLTFALTLGYDTGSVEITGISLREVVTEGLSIKKVTSSLKPTIISTSNRVIKFAQNLPQGSSVRVVSIKGQEIFKGDVSNTNEIILDSRLAAGWYAVTVKRVGMQLLNKSIVIK